MPAEIRPVSGAGCILAVWCGPAHRASRPSSAPEYKQLLAPSLMGTGLMQVSSEACRVTSSCSHQISVCSTAAGLLRDCCRSA